MKDKVIRDVAFASSAWDANNKFSRSAYYRGGKEGLQNWRSRVGHLPKLNTKNWFEMETSQLYRTVSFFQPIYALEV
jgi:hypothetical protein